MTVDLTSVPEYFNPSFKFLLTNQNRKVILLGGASSGKSYDKGLDIVYKTLADPGHRFLIVRKVSKTIRHSIWDLIIYIIIKWGMRDLFKINKTDMTITCVNGNEIIFTGLDDVEKLKSIFGITDIVVEEASEITEADFNQLDIRLRGKTKYKKQITLLLNPISALHWIKARFFDRQEADTFCHRSTYKDNIFLDDDTKINLENITDPYFRSVYVLGEWGVYGNVVFTNYIIEDFDYDENDLENICQGMDYGFAHASSIERVGFKDGELYIFDELYGKGWTNQDFIDNAFEQWGHNAKIWRITADSAEPDRIEEWRRAGYNVSAAKKGKGSLKYGIDFLSQHRMHIHATKCPNIAREVQMFKRKEDKDGNAIDDFVEINDDGIAAARYATEELWGQYHGELASWDLAALGL